MDEVMHRHVLFRTWIERMIPGHIVMAQYNRKMRAAVVAMCYQMALGFARILRSYLWKQSPILVELPIVAASLASTLGSRHEYPIFLVELWYIVQRMETRAGQGDRIIFQYVSVEAWS